MTVMGSPSVTLLRRCCADCLIDAALPAPGSPAAGEWASPMQVWGRTCIYDGNASVGRSALIGFWSAKGQPLI